MNVSIIIPAYNNEYTIGEVLDAIQTQKNTNQIEVIIIDDKSTDNTSQIIEEKGFKVIQNEQNQGLGNSLNKGISHAKYDTIVTLHGDTIPQNDSWLEQLTTPLQTPNVGACCSMQAPPDLEEVSYWEQLVWAKQEPHCALNNKADAYKKQILINIGKFDSETYRTAGEDEDIAYRIKKSGYSIVETQAKVQHNHIFTGTRKDKLKGIFKKEYIFGLAGGARRRKYPTYTPGIYLFPETRSFVYDGLFRVILCIGSILPVVRPIFIPPLLISSIIGIQTTLKKTKKTWTLIIYPIFNILRYYTYTLGYLMGIIKGKQT